MIADTQELGTNAKWGQVTWGKMELDGGKNCIKWHKIQLTSQIIPGNVFIFKINIEQQQNKTLAKDIDRRR